MNVLQRIIISNVSVMIFFTVATVFRIGFSYPDYYAWLAAGAIWLTTFIGLGFVEP